MARGKHATSAEARRARETAEAEVASLGHKVEAMEREIAGLKADLSAERTGRTAEVRRLNGLIEQGTSPEVESLRSQLADMEAGASRRAAAVIGLVRPMIPSGQTGILTRIAEELGVRYFSDEIAPLAKGSGSEIQFNRRDRRLGRKVLTNDRVQPYMDAAAKAASE